MPDLSLHQDWEAKRHEETAAQNTVDNATQALAEANEALATASAAREAAEAALAATMVPGKPYSLAADQLPTLVASDGRVQRVHAHFLGDPDPDVQTA